MIPAATPRPGSLTIPQGVRSRPHPPQTIRFRIVSLSQFEGGQVVVEGRKLPSLADAGRQRGVKVCGPPFTPHRCCVTEHRSVISIYARSLSL